MQFFNAWPSAALDKLGGGLPEKYVAFDTEFTSSGASGLLLELGYTVVEQGEVVESSNNVVNWYGFPGISESTLEAALQRLSFAVPNWQIDRMYLQQHGNAPSQVAEDVQSRFNELLAAGYVFIAQNGLTADEPTVSRFFKRASGVGFHIPDNLYFDVGGFYKALRLWHTSDKELSCYRGFSIPHHSESLKTYFRRLIAFRHKKLKWSLSLIAKNCDLVKTGAIDTGKTHSAGYDAECLSVIVEHWRKNGHTER